MCEKENRVRTERKSKKSTRKTHLDSPPAEDSQREDDGGHAAVGDGDDHDREDLELVRYVWSLDECVCGDIVKGADCVGRVGEKSFTALSRPEVDVHVPTSTLLEKVH